MPIQRGGSFNRSFNVGGVPDPASGDGLRGARVGGLGGAGRAGALSDSGLVSLSGPGATVTGGVLLTGEADTDPGESSAGAGAGGFGLTFLSEGAGSGP